MKSRKRSTRSQNKAIKHKNQLKVREVPRSDEDTGTLYAKKVKQKAQEAAQKQLKEKWKEKEMHGQYPK